MSNQEKQATLQKSTNQPNRGRKHLKKSGRKRVKHLFDETRLGHFLKHEAPFEYKLIMDANGAISDPSADFIEAISYSSSNPLFKKTKFRRCLIEYRKYGLYCGRAIKTNANIELYYIKIRKSQRQREIKIAKSVKR